jgi:hypothetical protein
MDVLAVHISGTMICFLDFKRCENESVRSWSVFAKKGIEPKRPMKKLEAPIHRK